MNSPLSIIFISPTTFSCVVSLINGRRLYLNKMKYIMNQTDEELVKAFQGGDDLAFVNLYNRYKRPVYLFCFRMLNDSENAKDVVQSVFSKIYERRRQLKEPAAFKSWLFSIARNDCLTVLRHARDRSELSEEVTESIIVEKEYDDSTTIVHRALLKLRPEDREVLILREYDRLSYMEIAGVLQATESAVKSRLFTARRHLFEILRPIMKERRKQ